MLYLPPFINLKNIRIIIHRIPTIIIHLCINTYLYTGTHK